LSFESYNLCFKYLKIFYHPVPCASSKTFMLGVVFTNSFIQIITSMTSIVFVQIS
jgi:hypothetical protein